MKKIKNDQKYVDIVQDTNRVSDPDSVLPKINQNHKKLAKALQELREILIAKNADIDEMFNLKDRE